MAVVITTYNDPLFLAEAIESVLAQTRAADEIFVVDDGSENDPRAIVSAFPQVTLCHKSNGGVSNARNYGLRKAKARYITFLDADDRFAPQAIEAGLRCYAQHPLAAMVYGAHRRIDSQGKVISEYPVKQVGTDPYAELLRGNCIGMHATVLYRRDELVAAGGFDESLRHCEDYELYLRLAQGREVVSHPEPVAEYRWHGANTSTDTGAMLEGALAVLERHRDQPPERKQAWHRGQQVWKDWYTGGQDCEWDTPDRQARLRWKFRKMLRRVARRLRDEMVNPSGR